MNTLKEYKAGYSKEEIDMLFNTVINQTKYFYNKFNFPNQAFDESLKYVERLINHEKPIIYIHTIINELKLENRPWQNTVEFTIYAYNALAFRIYVLLYYRYKDNAVYKDSILPHLQKLLGYFDSTSYPLSKTLEKIDALPSYNDVHSDKTKFLTEEEVSIIDKLTAENNRLEKKVKELEQRIEDMTFRDDDDDESEKAFIERENPRGGTKIHKTSAKECVKILNEENVKGKLTLDQWMTILSKLTGISKESFRNYISKPEL